jgi:hypothetical protein
MTNMNLHELTVEEVFRNLSPSTLYEHAILYEKDAHIAENGALVGLLPTPVSRPAARQKTNASSINALRKTKSGGVQ